MNGRNEPERKNTKVIWNNTDKNMVAEKNYGLKGGGVRISRPDAANTNAEFSGILITRLAETPK